MKGLFRQNNPTLWRNSLYPINPVYLEYYYSSYKPFLRKYTLRYCLMAAVKSEVELCLLDKRCFMASKFTYPGLKGILVGLGVLIISVTATGVRSDETEKSLPVALATFKENKPSTISINIKGQEPLGETTPRITPILITPEEPVAKVALLVNPNPQNSIEYSLQSDNNEPEYNELKYSEQPNAPQQILYPPTTIAMATRIVDQQAGCHVFVNGFFFLKEPGPPEFPPFPQSNQNQS